MLCRLRVSSRIHTKMRLIPLSLLDDIEGLQRRAVCRRGWEQGKHARQQTNGWGPTRKESCCVCLASQNSVASIIQTVEQQLEVPSNFVLDKKERKHTQLLLRLRGRAQPRGLKPRGRLLVARRRLAVVRPPRVFGGAEARDDWHTRGVPLAPPFRGALAEAQLLATDVSAPAGANGDGATHVRPRPAQRAPAVRGQIQQSSNAVPEVAASMGREGTNARRAGGMATAQAPPGAEGGCEAAAAAAAAASVARLCIAHSPMWSLSTGLFEPPGTSARSVDKSISVSS